MNCPVCKSGENHQSTKSTMKYEMKNDLHMYCTHTANFMHTPELDYIKHENHTLFGKHL